MNQQLDFYWLGRRSYAPIFEIMQKLVSARRAGENRDRVLLLEHEAVITLGRGAHQENILKSQSELRAIGIDVTETGRGGDVTLHAPGQLIAYPILALEKKLQDVRKYVQMLTKTMNHLLADYELAGGEKAGLIGLWLDANNPRHWPGEEAVEQPEKIGAIGVRINRWVTSHGFALNFNTDLSLFQLIVPCGIEQYGVTSVKKMTGTQADLKERASLTLGPISEYMNRTPSELQDLTHLDDTELDSFFFG